MGRRLAAPPGEGTAVREAWLTVTEEEAGAEAGGGSAATSALGPLRLARFMILFNISPYVSGRAAADEAPNCCPRIDPAPQSSYNNGGGQRGESLIIEGGGRRESNEESALKSIRPWICDKEREEMRFAREGEKKVE